MLNGVSKMSFFLWIAILRSISSVHCVTYGASTSPQESAETGVKWLESESLPDGGWRDGQTAAAILAMMAHNPLWYVAGADNNDRSELAVKQLELEILADSFQGKELAPGQLAQYLGALQATCRSPSSLHGVDLLSSALSQLDSLLSRNSPAGASLALAVCNTGTTITDTQVAQLDPRLDQQHHFGVERAGLAVMALMCASKQRRPGFKGTINRIVAQSGRYIAGRQQDDGGFGSVFATSVALQAHSAAPRRVGIDKVAAVRYLMEQAGVDGGYGTPLITSLVISALSDRSVLDIGKIKCISSGEEARVRYILEDTVITESAVRGSFPFEEGKTLLEALTEFARNNPAALQLETEVIEGLGTRIVGLNQIKNSPVNRLFWSVNRERRGEVIEISLGLEKLVTEPGDFYKFKYGTVTVQG